MNIFFLGTSAEECAVLQCDKHVVKMPLETAQLLCSAHPQGDAPYKRTHYNHPSAVWVRSSVTNYLWTIDHGRALCDEYYRRFGRKKRKNHASLDVIEWAASNVPDLPSLGWTTPPLCMPDKYKCADPVTAYRRYYIGDKAAIAQWKHGPTPSFMRS